MQHDLKNISFGKDELQSYTDVNLPKFKKSREDLSKNQTVLTNDRCKSYGNYYKQLKDSNYFSY